MAKLEHRIEQALKATKDFKSFVHRLLAGALDWPIEEGASEPSDIAWDWSEAELRAKDLSQKVVEGRIRQIQLLSAARQPWGIFLLEFADEDVFSKGRGMTSPLRAVLRGLVPTKRASGRDPGLPYWRREDLLFICTYDYRHFRFAYFKAPTEATRTAPLVTFGWNQGDTHVRTLCEWNLKALAFQTDHRTDTDAWLAGWRKAFDVEAVTRRFFKDYSEVFRYVEAQVDGVPAGEPRRLYTQRLFNRLMFLYFIERKGWLSYKGDHRYFRALFNDAVTREQDFLNDRLYSAFFHGLNVPRSTLTPDQLQLVRETCGDVPYLNGGLFEALEDQFDVRGAVKIPNEVFGRILDLFERYNFTVTESTPLDVEVAVDPEMLGKVFEELVTGRHETGSYYTPKPVVSFMCCEALKGYLGSRLPKEQAKAIAQFVDDHDPAGLRDAEAVLDALRAVTVCDPACGSGAYLLGMLHELLALRTCLFETKKLDPVSAYQRKLEIIANNVYGVDIDAFAVNIARLRLWLSLAVEFEGDTPPPLPNLDLKIEVGDSLSVPIPERAGQQAFRDKLIRDYGSARAQYTTAHGEAKLALWDNIAELRTDIATWTHAGEAVAGFDWAVDFAEVLARGGFDIVVANPP